MKKVQNLLTKPEQLRKRLQCPSFRHDFVQWSKAQLCGPPTKHPRSKSPNENSRKSLNPSLTKNQHNYSKQNIAPNSISKNNSVSKKTLNTNKSFSQPRFKPEINKKKGQNQSQSDFHSLTTISHNRSLQESTHEKTRSNYSSLHKNRDTMPVKSKEKRKNAQDSTFLRQSNVVQNKIQFKYSSRTRQGVLATNPNKTNQDRFLIKTKIGAHQKNLFVIADGHGSYGHLVAENIVKNYNTLSQRYFCNNKTAQSSFPQIYQDLQKNLCDSEVNASCSGSTLVSVTIQQNIITCANVGDSRAILARQVDRKSWEMIYLSQDQKPSVQSQKRRIIKNGGRVHALRDQKGEPVGPLRVWLPNQNIQGLAMSRSMGDNISKPYGVIHKPEIITLTGDKRDKFILIASDGVWEFISNQQVLQLIVPFYRENKLEEACDALLKFAYERWTVEDTSVVDDITFILIFFQN